MGYLHVCTYIVGYFYTYLIHLSLAHFKVRWGTCKVEIKNVISLICYSVSLFRQYNKKYVKKERAKQRAELVKAWKLLDVLGQGKCCLVPPTPTPPPPAPPTPPPSPPQHPPHSSSLSSVIAEVDVNSVGCGIARNR